MVNETMNLPVSLRQDELDLRRDRLAGLIHDRSCVEAEKKAEAARYADMLRQIEEEIVSTATEVRERAEYREVEVTRRKNFDLKVEEVVRIDTGEVVSTRALSVGECQTTIDDELGKRRREIRLAALDAEAEEVAAEAEREASE